ncbi:hypothetical protein H2248_002635 [Termitomyces sp. 'cryptogamus']|nr:hypothetical protein H2248_002635 [Termitomyces sp. 'cryptogamus']
MADNPQVPLKPMCIPLRLCASKIFSGTIPFSDLTEYPMMLKVMQGERPSRPKQCEHWKTPCTALGLDDDLWHLVERCWVADASQRPTMSKVVRELPPRRSVAPIDFATRDPKELITVKISWAGNL